MFRRMPLILLAEILLIAGFCQWIPLPCQSFLYGLSLSIQSVIIFLLPVIIFGLLFKTAVQMSRQASKTILFILVAICLSNFFSTILSFCAGSLVHHIDLSMAVPTGGPELKAAFTLSLPQWMSNGYSMACGIGLGVALGIFRPSVAASLAEKAEKLVALLLRAFLVIIPIFIFGFLVQMHYNQIIGMIFKNYGIIFALVTCAVFSYIALIYFVTSRWQGKSFFQSLKNMMPAAMVGFGSMSSAVAMPLTLLGAEKNTRNPNLVRSIIPATVNVHLIGDCFAVPMFALAILSGFGFAPPSLMSYLIFACYFVLAKFSDAAVPGGGVVVMLPILQTYLGFDAAMLSLITALYILFDPVITCANVLGNGGFAMALSGKDHELRRSG
ncbi:MAG: dicarboxylate/amino acid:cation symporter [Verrucomicrobia bacterium]|nr:dicarboxylate/amino acid:cation symporter [Verrucomicrobiota bacterium]